LREGLVVAIAGPPNAGKSTLLNRLAQREAAIVSPYAGTTRDVIEVHLDLGGYPMTLLDTAGIRETADPVEMEGVRRARARAAAADLVLWLTDAAAPGEGEQDPGLGGTGRQVPVWRLSTKIDLLAPAAASSLRGKMVQQSATGPVMLRSKETGDEAAGSAARTGGVERSTRGRGPSGEIATASAESSARASEGAGGAAPVTASSGSAPLPQVARSNQKNELKATLTAAGNPSLGSGGYKNEPNFIITGEVEFILSAEVGTGVDQLLKALFRFAERQLVGAEQALVTRQRHRQSLAAVQHILSGALTRFGGAKGQGQEELLAEELRRAAVELGRLTGRVDVEDILDVIFRDFCIGK
jgi:tRNA modification GTPase